MYGMLGFKGVGIWERWSCRHIAWNATGRARLGGMFFELAPHWIARAFLDLVKIWLRYAVGYGLEWVHHSRLWRRVDVLKEQRRGAVTVDLGADFALAVEKYSP